MFAAAVIAPASAFAQSTGTTPTTAGTARRNATTATPAPATAAAAPAPLFWRGTSLIIDQSTSLETLAPGLVQSALSLRSYQIWASLRPRFALGKLFTLTMRQDATFEVFPDYGETGSAGFFGDLWTDLAFRGIPAFAGIRTSVALRFQWPVALATRARNTYFTNALVVGLSREFELPRDQAISLSIAFVGSHPWVGSTSGGNRIESSPNVPSTPGQTGSIDRNGCSLAAIQAGTEARGPAVAVCGYGGAAMSAVFSLTSVLSLGYTTPVKGLSFSLQAILINSWLYTPPPAFVTDRMAGVVEVPNNGRAGDSPADLRSRALVGNGDQRMREFTWFSFSADYDATKWLSLSAGYYAYRSVTNEDGTYGNPLYAPGAYTRLFVTTTFSLDAIYEALAHGTEAAGGGSTSARSVTMNDQRGRRPYSPSEMARQLRTQQMASGTF
jgi:hypothetical protein